MSVKTQGTELWFLDPDTGLPVKVVCVTTFTGLTGARDQIEDTCLDSPARTYQPGMITPGQANLSFNFDPAEASHVRMHQLYVDGIKIDWALGWSDYTPPLPALGPAPTSDSGGFVLPATRTWTTFNGYLSDVPFDFALNAVVGSASVVQLSDLPVLVPKP